MKDKELREDVKRLEKEVFDLKWELKRMIWELHEFLGVERKSEPQKSFLAKKETAK